MDKYGIGFTQEAREKENKRLINQLWKLIPMRENEEDWISQHEVVLEEVAGLAELYRNQPKSIELVAKLEGLTSEVCEDFMVYRKTIFGCIELLSEVLRNG